MPVEREEAQLVGSEFDAEVVVLTNAWGEAQRSLIELATDPQLLVLAGGGAALADMARARAAALLRRARRDLDLLKAGTRAWGSRVLASEVQAGVTTASASLVRQGGRATISGALGVANSRTIEALLEELMIDADFAADASQRTLRRHFRLTQQLALEESAISRSLLISEARLEGLDRRAGRLAAEFRRATGNGQFVMVAGKRWHLEAYSELIARTRLTEAASEGALNFMKAAAIDLVRISDHGRTDPICDAFAGKVYSISGRSRRFPRLQRRPPFHPNCRHIILPFIAELKTEHELEFAEARSRNRIEAGVGIDRFEEVLNAAV